jgi:hypothetical protein
VTKPSLARSGREASRQMRECRSCLGSGTVALDAEYDAETGELVQEIADCPICEGAGKVSVFLYAVPRRRS